jgi:Zn-dependent metalloprotease
MGELVRRVTIVASIAAVVGGLLIVSGPTAAAAPASDPAAVAVARANQALSQHPAAVAASSSDAFAVKNLSTDTNGAAHVRYTRTYHGLRVSGGDVVVHNQADGSFAGASNGLARPLTLGVLPKVSAAAAQAAARGQFSGTIASTGAAELFIDASSGDAAKLAWETVVSGMRPDGQTPSKLHVITDAVTGAVLGSFDGIETVNGTGNSIYAGTVTVSTTLSGSTYTMIDPTHGNGNTCDMNNGTSSCSNFTDADNVWGNGSQSSDQSAGVDAHYGAALTFDYYKNVHGRNGIFGNGAGVPSRVHYGNAYINAFWDGAQMTYGDGASNQRPLVSIDVAGHEMSHGVTEAVAGLVYSGESGGLNEATSDIFGSMVEFFANNASDPGDYNIGEKININGNGTPLRYMYNPGLDGASHTCWSTSTQSVDVHYSSGPGNHFFFNLAEGTGATPFGTSPLCGSAPAMVGIGRAKAELIWFRALNIYFTSSTRYVLTSNPANTSRAYTLSAATDLYGLCSTEYKAVQAAWTAVNVAGNDATCGGGGTTVYFDNFEAANGWTTNPLGTDNATSGAWERGDPAQTSSGGVKQLGTTVSGTNDLVTARLAGSSAGANDIDGGTTTIQSGLITLPSTGTLTLTFSYYLAHGSNSSSADFFRAFVVTGSTTQVFQSLGAASNRNGVWTGSGSISLSGYAGQQIRIRFQAADASTASLVEAGVDDVRITQS